MNKFTIKTKLYLVLGIISMTMMALGLYSVYALKTVNEKAAEISGTWIPRIKEADDINTMTSDYRALQYNHLVSDTREGKAQMEQSMNEMNKQINETFDAYEKVARPERVGAIQAARGDWNNYVKEASGAVRSLSSEGKTMEAGAAMRGAVKTTYDQVTKKITELGKASMDGANQASADSEAMYNSTIKILSGVILIALVITAISLFLIIKNISSGINELMRVAQKVADGDLKESVHITSEDEIGILGQANNQMIGNLKSLIMQIQKTSTQMAASSEELTASAGQSAEVTQQIAGSIMKVAGLSTDQVGAVNSASSVVEELSAGIEETAATVTMAADNTNKAVEVAQNGNKSINDAVTQMNNIEKTVNKSASVVAKLGERSKEIGQIVDTIAGIAGQTNLLALNAAIEAARAGEQGKGFAVVAEEVRKLAEQSQEAAKQIGSLITEIQSDTESAVVAMDDGTKEVKIGTAVVTTAGQAFVQILEVVENVNKQANEVVSTMEEMAQGTQQIVDAVQEIDNSSKNVAAESQTVSAATEEQSASMEEIASASRNLAGLAEELHVASSKFRL